MQYPETFTIRDKHDADRFCKNIQQNDHVLVVGGGLLGLEMAASLLELNVDVTLANRNPRLMDRQLDNDSGNLLKEILLEKGMQILFNDEVNQITYHENKNYRVIFKSGKRQTFNSIVFAIGTRPNIEFAKNIVDTRRGIIVDEHLKTSIRFDSCHWRNCRI